MIRNQNKGNPPVKTRSAAKAPSAVKPGARAGIMEVARLAGVSKSTALRALTGVTLGLRRPALERAERVRAVAAKLGYQPSEFARSLRAAHTRVIGLAVGCFSNRFFSGVAETAMDEAERHGYRTLLELTRWNGEKSVDCLNHFRRLRMDGILYASAYSKEEFPLFNSFAAENYPLVMLHENDFGLPFVPRDVDKALADSVRHFASLGCPEIVFSAWNHRTPYDKHVIGVFRNACADCGVKASVHQPDDFSAMTALAAERPAAVIGNAPYALETFLAAAEALPGYTPRVIGVYDEWNWTRPHRFLSGVVLVPGGEQVRRAVRLLLARVEGRPDPGEGTVPAVFHPAADFPSMPVAYDPRSHLVRY
jgi:LacI family transcriptional regulator